jgi:hypothetical protein
MIIWACPCGSGFPFQSFVFKEKTKGFPLQSLTQNNFCDKNKLNDFPAQAVCVQKSSF